MNTTNPAHVRFHPVDPSTPAGMVLAKADIGFEQARGVRMSRFTLAPGASSWLDSHPERELWMVASGQGLLEVGEAAPCQVGAGDVLHFEPHRTHRLTNSGDGELAVFAIWWNES
jgi:quercetin dioxygenase-like cupin family protein